MISEDSIRSHDIRWGCYLAGPVFWVEGIIQGCDEYFQDYGTSERIAKPYHKRG